MRGMAAEVKRDTYNFAIIKNFPAYKSFAILKEPEPSALALFFKTLAKLLKGA
ncbi:MAG: hypothetical protein QXH30_02200 [Candidatus Bilamarchaeaceae archaeon]